ncbi:CDP-alcohol phosphatidyltransferase family protein [Nonomuraea sp. NBC_01738]|uniref:CDP-alcohol phosphatidyltransferase family protein n=1 Tax=Nonomuraea sp. NBC_01738 TaxID=2976003 RepID=UPI002E0E760F|nr:CDP-alcohol phosphatidyltransferase family protein [Nonomuraea sp. NBC_01738]
MNGLYALKPWYAARLGGVRALLLARDVRPATITVAGVGFGALAGAVLAWVAPGPLAALAVALLLAARLACANLDGGVARESGRTTRFGAVVNELGDRAAELAAIAGCVVLAGPALTAAAALAATLPRGPLWPEPPRGRGAARAVPPARPSAACRSSCSR